MILQKHDENVYSISRFLTAKECREFIRQAEETDFSKADALVHQDRQLLPTIRSTCLTIPLKSHGSMQRPRDVRKKRDKA